MSYMERYKELLRRLHDVAAEFGNDSVEADTIRDEMEDPWEGLSEQERVEVTRYSGTL